MGAYGGARMADAAFVPIKGYFTHALTNHRSRVDRNVFRRLDVSARNPSRILGGRVRVLLRKLLRCSQANTRRIIYIRPRIGTSLYEIGEKYAGDGAMSHSHSRIAGRNIYVGVIHRISADIRQTIDGFHDLAGPFTLRTADRWNVGKGP